MQPHYYTVTGTSANLSTTIHQRSTAPSFEEVFKRYYSDMFRYAFCITKTQDIAEEVVNDVFVKFWSAGESLHIRSSIRAFLVTATRNHAIDRLRKSVRLRNRLREISDVHTTDYALPHEIVVGEETERLIEAAIEALPPQGKLIFKMSRDHEMTYGEIARTLDLSIKTVEAHMGKSLKSLRANLREEGVMG